MQANITLNPLPSCSHQNHGVWFRPLFLVHRAHDISGLECLKETHQKDKNQFIPFPGNFFITLPTR